MNKKPNCNSRGFTLIEMLVVVAIIALLIAMLVPTIGGVMAQARTVGCLNNLRQQAAAILAYAGEREGELPFFEIEARDHGFNDNWAAQLVRGGYLDAPIARREDQIPSQSVFKCPAGLSDRLGSDTNAEGPWTQNPNAFRPRAAAFDHEDGDTAYIHLWFGLSARTEAESGNNVMPFIRTRNRNLTANILQITVPDTTVIAYDGWWTHNAFVPGRIIARHGRNRDLSNFSFFDGRAESIRTRMFDLRSTAPDVYPRFRR